MRENNNYFLIYSEQNSEMKKFTMLRNLPFKLVTPPQTHQITNKISAAPI